MLLRLPAGTPPISEWQHRPVLANLPHHCTATFALPALVPAPHAPPPARRSASPGRLAAFEDELFHAVEMVDAPIVMAVTSQLVDGSRAVGVAYVDAACRRLGAAQFEDDEQLCALERALVQLGAKEVVIPQVRSAARACGEGNEAQDWQPVYMQSASDLMWAASPSAGHVQQCGQNVGRQQAGAGVALALRGSHATLHLQDSATSSVENEKLQRVAAECDALVTRRPRSAFSAKDVRASVEVLSKAASAQQHEAIFERPLASAALAAVLTFSDVSSNSDNHSAPLSLSVAGLCLHQCCVVHMISRLRWSACLRRSMRIGGLLYRAVASFWSSSHRHPQRIRRYAGRFVLELFQPDEFMRLDMAAQRALHVFPARAEPRAAATGTSSIYGILNRTRTAMGKRLLRSWLKQPLTSVDAITQRHTAVQALVDDLELRCAACACQTCPQQCAERPNSTTLSVVLSSLAISSSASPNGFVLCREAVRDSHLRGIADVQRLARKLTARKISLQELCQLYMASNQLPALVDALGSHEGARSRRSGIFQQTWTGTVVHADPLTTLAGAAVQHRCLL
jgi:MutS domain III/MutS domain II